MPGSNPSSPSLKYGSLLVLIVQSTLHVIVLRYSRTLDGPKYTPSTAVVMSELLKFIICMLIYISEEKSIDGLWDKLFGAESKKWHVALVAALYFIQNNAHFISLTYLEPAVFQVTYQLKLFTTAFFSAVILNNHLSVGKWISLSILFFGICIINFTPSTNPSVEMNSFGEFLGLIAVIISCLTSGFASIWFLGLIQVCVADGASVRANGFFYGYTIWTWFSIFLMAFGGLVVAAVVKFADSVLKGFASSFSIILSSLVSVWLFNFQITTNFVIGTILVMFSTQQYMQGSVFEGLVTVKDSSKSSVGTLSRRGKKIILLTLIMLLFGSIIFFALDKHKHFEPVNLEVAVIPTTPDEAKKQNVELPKIMPDVKTSISKTESKVNSNVVKAYMMYMTNDVYACNGVILAESIIKLGKPDNIDIAVLVTSGVSETYREKLKKLNVRLIETEIWHQEHIVGNLHHYHDSLTKLLIFDDYGYKKVIFFDTDILLMKNVEHLFDLPVIDTYWAPRAYWLPQPFITSVLLVLDPGRGQLPALKEYVARGGENIFDMDALNYFWGAKCGVLNEEYTILDSDFYGAPSEKIKARFDSASVIHFSSPLGKPWWTLPESLERKPDMDPHMYWVFDSYWERKRRLCD